jgi:hypothetical protein
VIVVREDGEASVLGWPGAPGNRGDGERRAVLADHEPVPEVVGGGSVEEMTVATPVCVDGRMFLRTHDSLFCIGEK